MRVSCSVMVVPITLICKVEYKYFMRQSKSKSIKYINDNKLGDEKNKLFQQKTKN